MNEHHAFGGCRNLEDQYRCVGKALLAVEQQMFSRRNQLLFRETVSFVPLEVLESYLEDLLNSEVSEEKLFLESRGAWVNSSLVLLLGLFVSGGLGLFTHWQGAEEFISATFSILLFLPLVIAWYLSPRAGLLRRMAFARIVSREVAYRRGQDSDADHPLLRKGKVLSSWLSPSPTSSGTAKIFH